ncbi:unnamed protein product [Arabidopsis thaliana]|uniref:Glabrous enhancer-binding protein-like C-terminal domain-containing protein n=1 Tax=Arabidopsis thaliana TaxID=3702 RepID=A0A5S9WZQ8_ARATH|nr:unnamed protein product [Arabidopsis thaliana]
MHEDYEIVPLQTLIDYKNDIEVQFMKMVASLKRKYENNLVKAKNGDEHIRLHDLRAFQLSKFVWGDIEESPVKSKKVMSMNLELGKNKDTFPNSSLVRSLERFGVDELTPQQGLSSLDLEDKKIFEEQLESFAGYRIRVLFAKKWFSS